MNVINKLLGNFSFYKNVLPIELKPYYTRHAEGEGGQVYNFMKIWESIFSISLINPSFSCVFFTASFYDAFIITDCKASNGWIIFEL
jgi:hypothetical protein